jgi:hypothetical protein
LPHVFACIWLLPHQLYVRTLFDVPQVHITIFAAGDEQIGVIGHWRHAFDVTDNAMNCVHHLTRVVH